MAYNDNNHNNQTDELNLKEIMLRREEEAKYFNGNRIKVSAYGFPPHPDNDDDQFFLFCEDGTQSKMYVSSNGDVSTRDGDAIIFDEDKNYRVIRDFPHMKFMVEDNGKFAMNIAKLGYRVFLIDKPYNKDIGHENITRIKMLEEICSSI